MGDGSYFENVAEARSVVGTTRSTETQNAFRYDESIRTSGVKGTHPTLTIKGKRRECRDTPEHPATTPIAVLMDVTSSRGKDARLIHEQVPSLLGSLKVMGLVPDPQILWGAIGDPNSDIAPIQISQFEADRRIDEQLELILMEEGGGGTGEEGYELVAYYMAMYTDLDCWARGKKGFAFFTGDEAPYAVLDKLHVQTYIGEPLEYMLSTEDIFRELQRKYHSYLIYPGASAEARKAGIDSEIKQRLDAAGGRYQDVDLRASLIWNNRDDLDLHVETPAGDHIYFRNTRGRCGGFLDVDRNRDGTDVKPVENIRWEQGKAMRGRYKVWVENFRHWDSPSNVPFKVELDINGTIQTFSGTTAKNVFHQPIPIHEFVYTPGERADAVDPHIAYTDEVVLGKWKRYLPAANILRVTDPASTAEVILGVLSLQHGMSYDEFLKSMKKRKVVAARRDDVAVALKPYWEQGVFTAVDPDAFS